MMRFPLRLTAALTRARLAQLINHSRPLFQYLDPAEILHANSSQPVEHETLHTVLREHRGILRVAGSEPLDHPGVAHLIRALTRSGRLVFLETNGVALRRRIHEFQPLANFFLVVRFDTAHHEKFRLALEGLRAARLSGFYTVAYSPISSIATLAELQALNDSLAQVSIDGWLICAETEFVRGLAAEARSLIAGRSWSKLSELIEIEILSAGKREPRATKDLRPLTSESEQNPRKTAASSPEALQNDDAVKESAAAS